jgi:DNA polymerase I-like protein with 3'-5' exonuclease and polymerase domains
MGQVFSSRYALDFETTLIDLDRPWEAPQYVLGAACDGERGFFLPPDRVLTFLRAHWNEEAIFHNATFDLKVLDRLAAEQGSPIRVYDLVEQDRVWDTWLLHRLYTLADEGHTSGRKNEATLEHCVKTYLQCELPKDTKDSLGNDVRLSYGQYLGRPLQEIDRVYLDYLARDSLATVLVFEQLMTRTLSLLDSSRNTWGFVSPQWLESQIDRWGPQTHHIQLKAAIVLDAITANGIGVDASASKALLNKMEALLSELTAKLTACGHADGRGSARSLQARIAETLRAHPEISLSHTDTGRFETSEVALATLDQVDPFYGDLLDRKAVSKLKTTYLDKMAKERLHPAFDVLKTTGRTSSFGEINAQNLPRDDRVRRCFVPSPGTLLLDADYSTIEMATLAQSVLSQFGGQSKMAEAINAGADLHRLVAARVTGKDEGAVTKDERAKAKPINFGKPGGMGAQRLREYAYASYGIQLTEDEVEALEEAWFELFPEMTDFLDDHGDEAQELVRLLDLTLDGYCQAQGRTVSPWASAASPGAAPAWLGGMCLKVLRSHRPTKRSGEPYSPEEIDYFWDKAQALEPELKGGARKHLLSRKPSEALYQELRNLLGRSGAFTLTGRLRARASYCARHNTVFQGLAADGAKLALWRLWRTGYRLVNFIHDQVLIEVPETADLTAIAEAVEAIMVEAMQEVVPDVRVQVEWAYRRRWSKSQEDVVQLAEECADATLMHA